MKNRNVTITLSLLLLASLSLGACGRKGDPIRPSLARAQATDESDKKPDSVVVKSEERRFILDPLLD